MHSSKLTAFIIERLNPDSGALMPEVHFRLRLVDLSEVPLLLTRLCRAAQLATLDPDAALGHIAMDQDPPEMTLWVRAFRAQQVPVLWNPSLSIQLVRMSGPDPIYTVLRQFVGLA